MLNFIPFLLLTLTNRVTSMVLKKVTIGLGAFIHNSKACARVVSSGLTSFVILLIILELIFYSLLFYNQSTIFETVVFQ